MHVKSLQKPVLSQHLMALGEERLKEVQGNIKLPPELAPDLALVLALSDFVYQSWQSSPEDLEALLAADALDKPRTPEEFDTLVAACSEDDPSLQLRLLRRREQCRFIFRDLTRRADVRSSVQELSSFADSVVRGVADLHYRQLCEEHGQPLAESGKPLHMAILALGKLGGEELNLSSDIDLIFFYGEPGDDGHDAHAAHQNFFLKLARKLIASLDQVSADGFVFRVDMRLRPYGESGNLVPSLRAMEAYYVDQGRDWERYAFIRVRSIALDGGLGNEFLEWMEPFVYRRYLDFGAFGSMRSMKLLIVAEVERKQLTDNVKLGSGGIRDIEFMVQTLQLIFGARYPEIQSAGVLKVLPRLVTDDLMQEHERALLEDAYTFLRDAEHRIQAEADLQTQLLPTQEISRERLAQSMGFALWDDFRSRLDELRAEVSKLFAEVLHMPKADEAAGSHDEWTESWLELRAEQAVPRLNKLGMRDSEAVHQVLVEFRRTLDRAHLEPLVEDRFSHFVPKLLQILAGTEEPVTVLSRILDMASAVLRRSTYIAFLLESGRSMETLVEICRLSPWVAEQLSAQPVLLYQLDYLKSHDYLPNTAQLKKLLRVELAALDQEDMEGQMDELRRFKLSQEFDTAVLALMGDLPVEKVSDQLTWIAEVVLGEVLNLAWQQLSLRHGKPADENGRPCDPGFVILAYGKLGGLELGFGSDLDLVFLHGASQQGETSGPRPVSNETFYARLSQRIIHILSSLTGTGRLYEVDLRLRPFGDSSQPVTSFASFAGYQEKDAWTWEHQALVRARPVAGDPELMEKFQAVRRETLARPRDVEELRAAVVSMRQHMREHRKSEQKKEEVALARALFDLKHELGAIIDIEFMVQYLVLGQSRQHPALLQHTDNLRILADLEAVGLLPAADRELLEEAYLAYRTAVQFESLGGRVFAAGYQRLDELRARVVLVWQRLMQSDAV